MDLQTQSAKHEDELSVGSYIGKQLYQQGVAWGSVIGGAYAGTMAGKAVSKVTDMNKAGYYDILPKFMKKIPGFGAPVSDKALKVGGGVGMLAGSLIAGITLGYEHWQKVKREQLQVDELTRNLSDLEAFKKSDPELLAENKRLWTELHARDASAGKGHEQIIAQHQARQHGGWAEQATVSSEAAQTHARS
jgi:hypothetical protein